jgi:hypothetical protein
VLLGDGITTKSISEQIKLNIVFTDSTENIYSAFIDFLIFETGYDVVLGLPAIQKHFLQLLFTNLSDNVSNESLCCLDSSLNLSDIVDLEKPFSRSFDESIEESETEHPSSFSYALDYLGRPMDEIEKEYLSMFDSQITPEYRDNHKLISLLKTKGNKVF